MSELPSPPHAQPPRLLDQLRLDARNHFGRPQPGERYAQWAQRFILFHQKRHPRELKAAEVVRFLEHVGRTEKNAVDALKEAHEALSFQPMDKAIANPHHPNLRLRMRFRSLWHALSTSASITNSPLLMSIAANLLTSSALSFGRTSCR